ncbi:MAG: hypothetical protein J6Y10_05670 [Lachnospiraceae bacterium]|nr:hypothetical protein [Lachnospiraceae bacterium]
MTATKQKRNTLLFVGFLLLAGGLHIAANIVHNTVPPHYSVNTMLFCAEFVLYSSLLFFWLRSIRIRLLPTRAKTYMITLALLMILYLSLRAYKYRIAASPAGIRFSWYVFYVPMIMIPTLFLMVCIRIILGERSVRPDERLLLLPAGALTAIIITNDLHHLVFVPKEGVTNFTGKAGTYTYRLPFYLTYAWLILMILVGVILLIKIVGSGKNKRRILFILADILLCFFLIKLHDIYYLRFRLFGTDWNIRFVPPYESPEIHVFCMLAAFEFCIRKRLIPHNEDYSGYISKIPLPILITDRKMQPAYRSAGEIDASESVLSDALSAPVYPQPDQKLSGQSISGGYAFWMEDEREVRSANERLREANELLESENTLIEYENRQKEENAYLRSRHHIFHEIAEKMYPYQKRIEELLTSTQPGSADFRSRIADVSVLNTFVKRKTNLLLLSSEHDAIELRELQLAVSESARYLTYAGLKSSVDESGWPDVTLPSDTIIALYDTFEMLVEKMLGRATLLMVSYTGEGLRMASDTEMALPLSADVTPLPVSAEQQDDIWYLTVSVQKGGD